MIISEQEKLYRVVFGPHVTEKAVSGSDANIHVFKVAVGASKSEIKKAVEGLFEVSVSGVRTVNVKGKSKNFGKRQGRRQDWKKAYIRLADGHSLDVATEG